jgi:hypothetical protein
VIKLIQILIIIIFLGACDNIQKNNPNVKKSSTNICHEKGSQYYKQTKKFESFNSIKNCLNSGGRLPR